MNIASLLRFPGQVIGTVIDTVLTARAVARHGELFAAWAEPAREGLVEFEAEHEVLPGGFSWGDVAGTYREALSHYCNRCGSDYTDTHTCLRDSQSSSVVPPTTEANPAGVEAAPPISPPPAGANFDAIASSGGVTQLYRVIDLVNSGASPERVKQWCELQILKRTAR